MEQLTLKGMAFEGKHGYYREEREKGNRFEVDLTFRLDLSVSASSDSLRDTLNYERAEEITREIMEGPSVKLIETLCGKIGDALFEAFAELESLEVRVRKLDPPLRSPVKYAEVTLQWPR
ncbi:MAG: dihydroneopterin aldolase [Balneolaceae bacterium]|nr:dihydroneopterin aldolase [Balneolaceae bacterium]